MGAAACLKVSVVVPSYNCAAYVTEAVDSVLAQSHPNHEIIVVDDGSTDDTLTALGPYLGRIKVVSQSNQGIARARNRGIALASGDVIAFLDADDVWRPDKLERQVAVLQRLPHVGVCFTNYAPFGEPASYRTGFERHEGRLYRLARRSLGDDAYLLTEPRLLEEFVLHGSLPCWTSTVVVRRRCLDEVGTFDEHYTGPCYVEDIHLWLRLAKHFAFAYVDRVLADRRVRDSRVALCEEEHDSQVLSHTIHMLGSLHRWVRLTAAEQAAVDRRLAQHRLAAGYRELARDRRLGARSSLAESLRSRRSWKGLYYYVLTFLPAPALRMLRRCKRSLAASLDHGPYRRGVS